MGPYSRANTLKSPDYIPGGLLGYPINSYNIDIKPPVILISILYTCFTILSRILLCQIVAPTKILKIKLDKMLNRMYNRINAL